MEENKYKAALERAKSAIKECGGNVGRIKMIESIFSDELWESEDEQHRKWIIEYLYDGLRKSDEQFKGQFKAAIAWLEKQKSQWTDEDEKLFGDVITACYEYYGDFEPWPEIKNWLNNIKQRLQ